MTAGLSVSGRVLAVVAADMMIQIVIGSGEEEIHLDPSVADRDYSGENEQRIHIDVSTQNEDNHEFLLVFTNFRCKIASTRWVMFDPLRDQWEIMTEVEISAHIRAQNVAFLGILFFLYAIVFTFGYTEIVFFDGHLICGLVQSDSIAQAEGLDAEPSGGGNHVVVDQPADDDGEADVGKGQGRFESGVKLWEALHDRTWRASIFAVWYAVLALLYLTLSLRVCAITCIPVLRTFFRNWLNSSLVVGILLINTALVVTSRSYSMIPESFVYAWIVTIVYFLSLIFFTVGSVVRYHRQILSPTGRRNDV